MKKTNTVGTVAMMAAMASFIINDAFSKLATETLPPGQILVIRGAIACSILLLVCALTRSFKRIPTAIRRPLALRTVADALITVTYLTALIHLPISNATAINQVTPLAVTAGAAFFLGEKVGLLRWCAIFVGFTGVLIVVRPGMEGFSIYSVFVIGTVVFTTCRDLLTRSMSHEIPTPLLLLLTSFAVGLAGIPWSIGVSWQSLSLASFSFVAASAIFFVLANLFIFVAMRNGDVSFVSPFRYTAIVWAMLLGFLFWSEVPDAATILGTSVIVVTGIFSFFRKKQQRR